MSPEKRWKLKEADAAAMQQIQTDLNLHPALCRLLAIRGIRDYNTAKAFFRPVLSDLHDPFLMLGMQESVARIDRAKMAQEKIMVYGDYDVDGTTAVALVFSFLKKYYCSLPEQLTFYIPNRYREGYGISFAGIDQAAAEGCSLIISLDCGIKAVDKATYAKSKNIDLIICDHHLPDDILPDACAILNPKQPGCPYPYKELSGCGIGFKLITALAQHWKLPEESYMQFLDLVATSIAADIVPVTGENRVLAYYGLQRINKTPSPAMSALKAVAALKRDISISDLVFVMAPRINAAGRMDDAAKVVRFFTEDDTTQVQELAETLHSHNYDRKEADKQITEEALAMLDRQNLTERRFSTVLYQPHWHKGVLGIVASRLVEQYYRPTIVLTGSDGKITGSARSVPGFNIYEAIHACREHLDHYGGHYFAAGLTLDEKEFPAFRERFESVVRETIQQESLYPEMSIDAEISMADIKPSFYNILKQLEPYGPQNLRPVFVSRNLQDTKGFSRIVKEQHLKIVVGGNRQLVSGIAFNMAGKYELVKNGTRFDVVYTIEENEWNGKTSLQLQVMDIKPSGKFVP